MVTAATDIQRQGELDILLRCLEDEFRPGADNGHPMTIHYQMMFSESWVVGLYEIFRAFQQRDREAREAKKPTSGVSKMDEFRSIFDDLELLRMPIAKYEIAKDRRLTEPLPMRRVGDDSDKPVEYYDPNDPSRVHIMPKGVSSRGSAVWLALSSIQSVDSGQCTAATAADFLCMVPNGAAVHPSYATGDKEALAGFLDAVAKRWLTGLVSNLVGDPKRGYRNC
ncbi:hypothetical protein ACRQ5Q_11520 [Bradyrhizobium sp. PMVTL-01]|uniref:hypothetical protein n=1 Tax=Bradyrhizobium sp. PMVTL-01 TaxID=3434999 RepID=UPI003F6EFB7A